jgi:hypothetical protein
MPILATRQNETELLPLKETLTNEKAKLTQRKLKRRLKPIKDESGEWGKL